MTHFSIARRAPALVLGLALAGMSAAAFGLPASGAGADAEAATPASGNRSAPLACEIVLDERRGSTTIEGRVTSDRAVRGSYRLAIRSSSRAGSTAISQSGDFDARPGVPEVLGQTTLAGPRGNFTAELELTVGGRRLTCSEAGGSRTL
jgi:hypothetical protein